MISLCIDIPRNHFVYFKFENDHGLDYATYIGISLMFNIALFSTFILPFTCKMDLLII